VDGPSGDAAQVVGLAMFNERNPQPEVFRVRLGARAGRAEFSTRIRLATTQRLVAVAQWADGSFWSESVDVIVTLAACIEEEGHG
jgi:sulfur-oxidizing protein SoxY